MACGPFSIHALLAESDRFVTAFRGSVDSFLSTLSLRRATIGLVFLWWGVRFSIHALLAESDQRNKFRDSRNSHFLSTLSLRRATTAPRTGLTCGGGFFYPRSPCGERQLDTLANNPPFDFLSTLSLRRATAGKHVQPPTQPIFYPRSPCGERPGKVNSMLTLIQFSIHALLAESDIMCTRILPHDCRFSIHALLAESDAETAKTSIGDIKFSIHALLAESDLQE